ncbi:hypothetical protein KCU83_g6133, partial [Aureobasidium melanogenum]
MDVNFAEALSSSDREISNLASEIAALDSEHRGRRRRLLWDLAVTTYKKQHPVLNFSTIVTVVDAAPDEEAQLQAVMLRLAKRGVMQSLITELAIATVGPHDTDSIVDFMNSLAFEKIEHTKSAEGKDLVRCVACEEELPPKDLILATCGHCYCGSCLSIAFHAAVSDESLYPPRCCAQNPIPIEHAKRFLAAELERTFEEKGVEFNTIDRTYCSDPTCSKFIPLGTTNNDIAWCHTCDKATCVVCKAPAHEGDCPADLDLAAMLEYAEEMRWQRCYNCLMVVQRRQGCNHMECRCGHSFCYNCGRSMDLPEEATCPCFHDNLPVYRFYQRGVDRPQPAEAPLDATAWDEPEFLPEGLTWDLIPIPAVNGNDSGPRETDMQVEEREVVVDAIHHPDADNDEQDPAEEMRPLDFEDSSVAHQDPSTSDGMSRRSRPGPHRTFRARLGPHRRLRGI